jgi:putative transposase
VPPLQFFDPTASFAVIERGLPHWAQAGTVCFLTWRTWDSMPTGWVEQWLADRSAWLRQHGIEPTGDWREQVRRLPPGLQTEFNRTFASRWESTLDRCHGSCPLRDPQLSAVVGDCLRHLDGTAYRLTDFVVMPNHVHILAVFPDESAMLARCEAWKRYTAVRLNRALGRKGRFWQVDGFDHLVRDAVQFDKFRRYIADNPRRAGLKPGEYLWYSTAGAVRVADSDRVADSRREAVRSSGWPTLAESRTGAEAGESARRE